MVSFDEKPAGPDKKYLARIDPEIGEVEVPAPNPPRRLLTQGAPSALLAAVAISTVIFILTSPGASATASSTCSLVAFDPQSSCTECRFLVEIDGLPEGENQVSYAITFEDDANTGRKTQPTESVFDSCPRDITAGSVSCCNWIESADQFCDESPWSCTYTVNGVGLPTAVRVGSNSANSIALTLLIVFAVLLVLVVWLVRAMQASYDRKVRHNEAVRQVTKWREEESAKALAQREKAEVYSLTEAQRRKQMEAEQKAAAAATKGDDEPSHPIEPRSPISGKRRTISRKSTAQLAAMVANGIRPEELSDGATKTPKSSKIPGYIPPEQQTVVRSGYVITSAECRTPTTPYKPKSISALRNPSNPGSAHNAFSPRSQPASPKSTRGRNLGFAKD